MINSAACTRKRRSIAHTCSVAKTSTPMLACSTRDTWPDARGTPAVCPARVACYRSRVRLCSVSIDLDEIACYSQIHGLETAAERHPVYDLALPRIRRFAADCGLPLTLFVIAR